MKPRASVTTTVTIVIAAMGLAGSAGAAITTYTDETAYLGALAAAGYVTVQESFENDAAWGDVRTTIVGGTNAAPSVANLGVVWSSNNANSGITTGASSARTGSWGFFELPHGDFFTDPINPIGDGFSGQPAAAVFAVGGWFSGQGGSAQIEFILDGTRSTGFNGVLLGSQHQFLGIIDTQAFQLFEIHETEGTTEDQNFIFADDFTIGFPASSLGVCGDGSTGLGEQCDDGGTAAGDCCSPQCQFETGLCDDGDPCTDNDTCTAGTCVASPVDCEDGDVCTDDTCNASGVCVHTDNTDPCNDGLACTTSDLCSGGQCGGTPNNGLCNDSNVCTNDACNPATGCQYTNNTSSCNDGVACTTGDTCGGGQCGGTPNNGLCDDSDVCTDNACNTVTGCQATNNAAPCDDGDACTMDDTCAAGLCAGTPISGCGTTTTTTSTTSTTSLPATTTTSTTTTTTVPAPTTTSTSTTQTTSTLPNTTTTSLPGDGCPPSPLTGCLTARASRLKVTNKTDDTKDALGWNWFKGAEISHAALGDPTVDTAYVLCVYDTAGGGWLKASILVVPPGPAWRDKNPKGFTYKDKLGVADGVVKMRLAPGVTGRAKTTLKAKGANVPIPGLTSSLQLFEIDPEVVVQLLSSEGPCWEAIYDGQSVKKSTDERFKAATK